MGFHGIKRQSTDQRSQRGSTPGARIDTMTTDRPSSATTLPNAHWPLKEMDGFLTGYSLYMVVQVVSNMELFIHVHPQ